MAKGDICNYIIFIEKVYQLYIYTSSRKELFIFMEHCKLYLKWNTVTYLKWNTVNSILQHTLIFHH